jgi:putative DNA methylase
MAVFSKYAAVLEADGTPMSVKTALQLINRFLAEDDFDHDTQFCLHWFDQHGWAEGGKYGEADVLARAKATSVGGLQEAGVIDSGAGKGCAFCVGRVPARLGPRTDSRLPVWEALHHLIRALNQDGESAAGALLARMPARAEPIERANEAGLPALHAVRAQGLGGGQPARTTNCLLCLSNAISDGVSRLGAGEVPSF